MLILRLPQYHAEKMGVIDTNQLTNKKNIGSLTGTFQWDLSMLMMLTVTLDN